MVVDRRVEVISSRRKFTFSKFSWSDLKQVSESVKGYEIYSLVSDFKTAKYKGKELGTERQRNI